GEQCDPPGAEDCDNGIDDDGDGATDCSDLKCITGLPTCSSTCQIIPTCQQILSDPAFMQFGKDGDQDYLSIHARFIPLTPVDLYTDEVAFEMSNSNGIFYRGRLFPGDLKPNAKGVRWRYADPLAKAGMGARSGISLLTVRSRMIDGKL